MEEVDQAVVREFHELKTAIEELEAEQERYEASIADKKARIEEVKNRWLEQLQAMVDKIAGRFENKIEA